MEGAMLKAILCNKSVSRIEIDQRARDSISKQGRSHARGMLVEAAWAAALTPGPLWVFFPRIRGRKGQHVSTNPVQFQACFLPVPACA
jgi:hypothetical protein